MARQRAGVAWLEPLVRRGGWPWGSIWNEVERPIRKITEGTTGCIVTSLRSWNALVKERRQRRWSCGQSKFNRERPHEALGMRCPAELYRDSAKRYSGAIRPYPDEYVTAWN
jgi:hypothetical protein